MKQLRIYIEDKQHRELKLLLKRRREMGEMLDWNMFLQLIIEQGLNMDYFIDKNNGLRKEE